ncbi:uncharacterized protein LOC131637279 [Vicia villosa]|uniref:uncharacterized protein LOC131637279 n=1 Tax=Vicia villosa TaxID=3911 RepID=UPI00273C36EB|nr:uncharacterized protein LOC131637279 [Vicia villosa]
MESTAAATSPSTVKESTAITVVATSPSTTVKDRKRKGEIMLSSITELDIIQTHPLASLAALGICFFTWSYHLNNKAYFSVCKPPRFLNSRYLFAYVVFSLASFLVTTLVNLLLRRAIRLGSNGAVYINRYTLSIGKLLSGFGFLGFCFPMLSFLTLLQITPPCVRGDSVDAYIVMFLVIVPTLSVLYIAHGLYYIWKLF